MKIELISCQGNKYSLYINGTRVAGGKPWGGGTTVAEWKVTPQTILSAMGKKYTDLLTKSEEA